MQDGYKEIFEHYGFDNQIVQMGEEVGELLQVLSKIHRKGANYELTRNLIEELADVNVMIKQFCYYCGITEKMLDTFSEQKMIRQLKRIKETKNEL